jgi:hypothetical protein
MMNIARLDDFGVLDTQKAILYLAWQAREYLGDAERLENAGLATRSDWCHQSASILLTAITLFDRAREAAVPSISETPAYMRSRDLLCRAHWAAEAADKNGKIAGSYYGAVFSETPPTAWEKGHAPKAISIFKRAAETGRQETHRALVELCELFPKAIPEDDA